MRNIVVLRDQPYALSKLNTINIQDLLIKSVTFDKASSKVFALTSNGTIYCFNDIDDNLVLNVIFYATAQDLANSEEVSLTSKWFDINFLAGIGSLICISHSGEIIAFEENQLCGDFNGIKCDEIGVIEGGILAASWNPDQSCIAIVTNNNTILCMSSTWDVLLEIPLSSKVLSAVYPYISWKGDGDGLSIISVDQEDNLSKLRIYNKQLELVAIARNVTDGAGSVIKGLGKVAAYATNGSYLSVIQERVKGKLQVALIEKNGLRHGDFDLQLPHVPLGLDKWEEVSICWDLPSTLIAVSLKAVKDKSKHNSGDNNNNNNQIDNEIGIVQLYYRGNYHWYLKQQWIGEDLKFIRFDEEILNRFYISQTMRSSNDCYSVIRRIDFTWDVSNSLSSDSAVAVIDGNKLLVTPLGKHTIPPPMSKYSINLQSANNLTQNNIRICPPNCTRYANFWIPNSNKSDNNVSDINWGLVSLADDNATMNIMFGDVNGLLLSQHTLSIINEIPDLATKNLIFRSISVSQVDTNMYICLLGSCLIHLGIGLESYVQKSDELLVLHYTVLTTNNNSILQINRMSAHLITGFAGQINRIFQVPNNYLQVGVGVMNTISGEFDIYTVDITPPFPITEQSSRSNQPEKDVLLLVDININIPVLVATIPEQCSHLLFVCDTHDQSNVKKCNENDVHCISEARNQEILTPVSNTTCNSSIVLSLSLKNRLYCGEYYLSAGVSSFVYNNSFRMLMYATLGARPHLHFSSLERLVSLDPLQHTEDQSPFECAEPRPLERGSRLVVSVESSSKVIVQLPRGNLECIEPRVLILLRAQHLLVNKNLFDCLVLLRKQRVDLNYITDYNPQIFLDNVESMVKDTLKENPDLISLFVTSIEPIDVTQYKYPSAKAATTASQLILQEKGNKEDGNITNIKDMFKGDAKVNIVCTAVRDVLLPILKDYRSIKNTSTNMNNSNISSSSSSSSQVSSLIQCSRILQPILCTYAKQRPVELVQALELIRNCSCILTSLDNTTRKYTNDDLSNPLVQVSIKYLAFLAEGNALFEAALGVCDFSMARAIARQCQMDPKIYLPLIDSFESIGEKFLSTTVVIEHDSIVTSSSNAPQVSIMHYKVNIHLKRHQPTVDWFINIFDRYFNAFTNQEIKTQFENIIGSNIWLELYDSIILLVNEFKIVVKEFDLFQYAIPKLNNLYVKLNTIFLPSNYRKLLNDVELQLYQKYVDMYMLLLNDIKVQYGLQCKAKKDYAEALATMLSTQPMQAIYSIEIARLMGNWQLALSIAEKYSCDERYKDTNELDPKRIAQEIVNEYKQNLEQGSSFIDQVVTNTSYFDITNYNNSNTSTMNDNDNGDKVLEIVDLCIDYCHDPEEAISILSITQRWVMALQYCMKHNRNDLFSEITVTIRTTAKEMMNDLTRKGLKIISLVKDLTELWQYPDIRLQNVASTDTTLLDELNGTMDNEIIDETSSEYSGMTEQSTYSKNSTSSRSSIRSGTSTVSVLSNLSDAGNENKSITSNNKNNDSKNNSFSISGLEHSLLSRGTIPIDEETGLPIMNKKGKKGDKGGGSYKRDQSERRQKRIERSKAKGYSKDIWGLLKETNICEELLKYIKELNIISKSTRDICQILLFLNTCNDIVLANELQLATNSYIQLIQKNPAPVAPLYPKDWLMKRNMHAILHYQDITQTTNSLTMKSILLKRIPRMNKDTPSYNNNSNNISELKIEQQQQQMIIKEINRMILGVDTWWDIAAKGIQDWNHVMKTTLKYN